MFGLLYQGVKAQFKNGWSKSNSDNTFTLKKPGEKLNLFSDKNLYLAPFSSNELFVFKWELTNSTCSMQRSTANQNRVREVCKVYSQSEEGTRRMQSLQPMRRRYAGIVFRFISVIVFRFISVTFASSNRTHINL